MTAVVFDTLAFAKGAKEAGFTVEQAEYQAEALARIFEDRIATKSDINEIQRDLRDLESRLIIKFGGMLVVAVGILAVLIKIL
jgi:hypothetical protein